MKRALWISVLLLQAVLCYGQKTDEYRLDRDISYVSSGETDEYRLERCKLDLYYPADSKDFATVVWFHGGGLTGGSKYIPKEFLKRGYAVAAVNYRLSPRATNPAYTDDAAEAVAWIFGNIDRFGGSTEKIYIAGHSAGGYLALMLALDKRFLGKYGANADKLAGAFPVSGQTTTHYTVRKERGLPPKVPIIDEYAPSNNVRKTPFPITLITGGRKSEMTARYEENLHLYALLKALGQEVSIYELDGFSHKSVVAPACLLIDGKIRAEERKK